MCKEEKKGVRKEEEEEGEEVMLFVIVSVIRSFTSVGQGVPLFRRDVTCGSKDQR